MRSDLFDLIRACELAAAKVLHAKTCVATQDAALPDFASLFKEEGKVRSNLIDWEAPNAALATEKLLHILAHVLARGVAFDQPTLDSICRQTRQLLKHPGSS